MPATCSAHASRNSSRDRDVLYRPSSAANFSSYHFAAAAAAAPATALVDSVPFFTVLVEILQQFAGQFGHKDLRLVPGQQAHDLVQIEVSDERGGVGVVLVYLSQHAQERLAHNGLGVVQPFHHLYDEPRGGAERLFVRIRLLERQQKTGGGDGLDFREGLGKGEFVGVEDLSGSW